MDYTEAVKLAKAGEEKGFSFLYEQTYKSKYYLALKYMKNDEAAQDVLQDAYMKAFSKLDMLEQPEAFPGWFGKIVGNTAKNMLKKNNPMLFSDVAVDDENNDFEYQIEDDNVENQPEIAYTRQETQELVHELMDTLSEEQRMCILMFHIEGASIKEIASALDCSENTVKSRLKYGRDNLKVKAEELQKKGYKLYSIAPLPLLLYLLRTEEGYLIADGTLIATGESMAEPIFRSLAKGTEGASAGAKELTGNSAKAAAKSGFLHTVAGKVTVVVIGLCIAGGAVFYGVSQMQQKEQEPETEIVQEQNETEIEEDVDETPVVKELQDEDYASLIVGNLTKEELEYVLAYGPDEIPAQGFQDSDYKLILNILCDGSSRSGNFIEQFETDANYKARFSLSDVNRMFSAFTTYQFTEENDDDTEYGIDVDGDVIALPLASAYIAKATITSAEYTDEEMNVYYTYDYTSGDGQTKYTLSKKALLEPEEDGLYRIVKIEEVGTESDEEKDKESAEGGQTMKEVYASVLEAVRNQESGYDFPNINTLTGKYQYFLYDMDADGIKELIVGAEFEDSNGTILVNECRVYSCEKTGDAYMLKTIDGDISALNIYLAADGNGLYRQDFSKGTGWIGFKRITIQNGVLIAAENAEYECTLGDSDYENFISTNGSPQWLDITNKAGLSSLD